MDRDSAADTCHAYRDQRKATVSIHDLRHAFASRMISRGVEPVTLASLMGHEDARITLSRYAHVYDKRRTDEAVRQAMAR